jgi:hypothetical protein
MQGYQGKPGTVSKPLSLTRRLVSLSPRGSSVPSPSVIPSSPTAAPTKSPKQLRHFAYPFPNTQPSSTKSALRDTNTLVIPRTPSRHHPLDPTSSLLTPQTPSANPLADQNRQQAPYERVRQRSLTASPSNPSGHIYCRWNVFCG